MNNEINFYEREQFKNLSMYFCIVRQQREMRKFEDTTKFNKVLTGAMCVFVDIYINYNIGSKRRYEICHVILLIDDIINLRCILLSLNRDIALPLPSPRNQEKLLIVSINYKTDNRYQQELIAKLNVTDAISIKSAFDLFFFLSNKINPRVLISSQSALSGCLHEFKFNFAYHARVILKYQTNTYVGNTKMTDYFHRGSPNNLISSV